MKTGIAAFAVAMIIAINLGFGQTSASSAYGEASQRGEPQKKSITLEQKAETAKKNYIVALQSENTGLVESTIKMIAKMKLRVPSADATELREELDELSVTHPSATVRYKAYIASSICSDPEWYAQEKNVVTADEDQFFIGAANRLQQKLFGLRIEEQNSL